MEALKYIPSFHFYIISNILESNHFGIQSFWIPIILESNHLGIILIIIVLESNSFHYFLNIAIKYESILFGIILYHFNPRGQGSEFFESCVKTMVWDWNNIFYLSEFPRDCWNWVILTKNLLILAIFRYSNSLNIWSKVF